MVCRLVCHAAFVGEFVTVDGGHGGVSALAGDGEQIDALHDTDGCVLALLFGLFAVIGGHLWGGWAHSKITLGVVLLGYHFYSWRLLQDFREGRNHYGQRWYRFYSEVPIVLMALALYLVVFKPF